MSRLIDADKLKAHFAWWKGGTYEMTMDEAKSDFDTIIDLQPTVDVVPAEDYRSMEQTVYKLTQALAEAEPIVWCKDCKNLCVNEYGQWCVGGFVHELSPIENDDFCSRGERRENVNSDTDTDDI